MFIECGLQDHSLHNAQLQTKVMTELRTPEVHTQCCQPLRWVLQRSPGSLAVKHNHCRRKRYQGRWQLQPFTEAFDNFGNSHVLRGNNIIIGENEIHIIQTKGQTTQLASGCHPRSHAAAPSSACSEYSTCILCVLLFTSSHYSRFSVVLRHSGDREHSQLTSILHQLHDLSNRQLQLLNDFSDMLDYLNIFTRPSITP